MSMTQPVVPSIQTKFLIITGMSGAGKTQVIRALEDLGFFCVDNFPPVLIDKFAELCAKSQGRIRRVALVIDIRGGLFFDDLFSALEKLENEGYPYQILFLEASDETLIRRFKETRRRHPLAVEGRVVEGISQERKRLSAIRGRANWIIDTSAMSTRQLRQDVTAIFSDDQEMDRIIVHMVSFGFKRGIPMDSDLLFDVRFLPNPHYVEELRPLDGTQLSVKEYVFKWPVTRMFVQKCLEFVEFLLPHYLTEGKNQLTVSIGCTGGRHRSVAIADHLAAQLTERGYKVLVEHRDANKEDLGVDD